MALTIGFRWCIDRAGTQRKYVSLVTKHRSPASRLLRIRVSVPKTQPRLAKTLRWEFTVRGRLRLLPQYGSMCCSI